MNGPLIIDPHWDGVVIPRTARKEWRCVAADEVKYYTITAKRPGVTSERSAHDLETARERVAEMKEHYPAAVVTVHPVLNPEYRADCLVHIMPGDRYGEYMGEAAAYQSGSRYCARCTTAVWGRPAASPWKETS